MAWLGSATVEFFSHKSCVTSFTTLAQWQPSKACRSHKPGRKIFIPFIEFLQRLYRLGSCLTVDLDVLFKLIKGVTVATAMTSESPFLKSGRPRVTVSLTSQAVSTPPAAAAAAPQAHAQAEDPHQRLGTCCLATAAATGSCCRLSGTATPWKCGPDADERRAAC